MGKNSPIFHLITDYSGFGGAERFLTNLLIAMDSPHELASMCGLNAQLFCDLTTKKHIRLHRPMNIKKEMGLVPFIRLYKNIKASNAPVLVGWMYHANLLLALLKLLIFRKKKLVWNIRHSLGHMSSESRMTRIVIWVSAKLSFLPDVIIYNSQAAKEQHEAVGFCGKNSVCIPNGIDTARFSLVDRADRPVKKEMKIGVLGRNHAVKNYEAFLSVVSEIKDSSLKFYMKGDNLEPLAPLVDSLGLSSDVEFFEPDNHPEVYLHELDLLVLPSHAEGFPNVVAEAMSTGLPCVVTEAGDASAIVGDLGWVVPVRDNQALLEAIKCGISDVKNQNVEPLRYREHIEKNFSIQQCAKQFQAHFFDSAA